MCALQNIYGTVLNAHCAVYNVRCTVYNVKCTICTQCTWQSYERIVFTRLPDAKTCTRMNISTHRHAHEWIRPRMDTPTVIRTIWAILVNLQRASPRSPVGPDILTYAWLPYPWDIYKCRRWPLTALPYNYNLDI